MVNVVPLCRVEYSVQSGRCSTTILCSTTGLSAVCSLPHFVVCTTDRTNFNAFGSKTYSCHTLIYIDAYAICFKNVTNGQKFHHASSHPYYGASHRMQLQISRQFKHEYFGVLVLVLLQYI